MDPTNKVGRREFTVASALALLNGVAITVTACSSSSDSPTAPTVTPGGGSSGSISLNHGHTAVITGAELTAANDIELDISGTADHPHSVSLTGGELQQIAGGTRVSTESTTMTTTRSWLGSGRGCVYLLGEYVPRLTGFDAGAHHLSFGIEKRAGGHTFQLNFSNSLGTTPAQLAQGGSKDDWFIGFNIARKFY